jgi:hypothetical protein
MQKFHPFFFVAIDPARERERERERERGAGLEGNDFSAFPPTGYQFQAKEKKLKKKHKCTFHVS